MQNEFVTVKVLQNEKEISLSLRRGANLLDVLREHKIPLASPCGGNGTCGKCRVKFIKNPPAPTAEEKNLIPARELETGVRLACRGYFRAYAGCFSDSFRSAQRPVWEQTDDADRAHWGGRRPCNRILCKQYYFVDFCEGIAGKRRNNRRWLFVGRRFGG